LSEEDDLNWTATHTPLFIYGICVLTTAWWFKFKVKPPIDHADYCHTTRYTGIGSRLAKFEGYSLCDLSYNVNHECTEGVAVQLRSYSSDNKPVYIIPQVTWVRGYTPIPIVSVMISKHLNAHGRRFHRSVTVSYSFPQSRHNSNPGSVERITSTTEWILGPMTLNLISTLFDDWTIDSNISELISGYLTCWL
jgi:hypothetical protein